MRVTLRDGDSDVAEVRVPYVEVDGQHYIDCAAFRLSRPLTARAELPPRAGGPAPAAFGLVEPADGDHAAVVRQFDQKYGDGDAKRLILRLVP